MAHGLLPRFGFAALTALVFLLSGCSTAGEGDTRLLDGGDVDADADAFDGGAEDGGSPDATPFSAHLTAPADGAALGGQVTVQADVLGASDLRGVEFYAGGVRFDTDLVPPWDAQLDTTDHPDGPLELGVFAVAIDGTTVSDTRTITVDNSAPTITQIAPEDAAELFYEDDRFRLAFQIDDATLGDEATITVNGVLQESTLSLAGTLQAEVTMDALFIEREALPLDLVVVVEATDALGQLATRSFTHRVVSRLRWTYAALGELWAAPVVGADETIYAAGTDGVLHAVNPDGTQRWTYDSGAEIQSAPALDSAGNLYFGAGALLHSVNAEGQRRWTFNTGGAAPGSPALSPDESTVYIGSYSDQLHAVNANNGNGRWAYPAGADILSSPVVGPDGTLYVGSHDQQLHAVDPEGASIWRFSTAGEIWARPIVSATGAVIFGSNDGFLYAVEPMAGIRLWDFDTRGPIWGSATEAADGALYIASTSRRLRALTAEGQLTWQFDTGGLAQSSPVLDNQGTLYFGSTDGTFHVLSPDGTPRWRFEADTQILGSGALSKDESTVYFGGTNRQLVALRTGLPSIRCETQELVTIGDVEMMRYEASRPDASAESAGVSAGAGCSAPGVVPWTEVSFEEATAACAAAGMGLCSASNWSLACAGELGRAYPFGEVTDVGACNGADNPEGGCGELICDPALTGAFARCLNPEGVFDLSGNVWEWTAQQSPLLGGGFQVIRGGSVRSEADRLRCDFDDSAVNHVPVETRSADVGFRCCRPVQ